MFSLNPNDNIQRMLLLKILRKESVEMLEVMRQENQALWLSHGEQFLASGYDREQSRQVWWQRIVEMGDMPDELQVLGIDYMVEILLETVEAYFHHHRDQVAELLGRQIESPFTPKQSIDRLLDDLFGPPDQ